MPIGVTVVLRRMGRVPKARPQPPKSFPLKHNQECKRQAPSFSLRRLQAEPGTCLGTESAPGLGWALRRTPRTVSLAPRDTHAEYVPCGQEVEPECTTGRDLAGDLSRATNWKVAEPTLEAKQPGPKDSAVNTALHRTQEKGSSCL